MKFTLTFEGTLQTGGAKANRKHMRRRMFHTQLKRLWSVNPLLADWYLPIDAHHAAPAPEVLSNKYANFGSFKFVPLITKELSVEAALHFHILRPTTFKGQTADPDNIIKILVDSLKMPQHADELPNIAQPQEDERPLFVLMQDDGLLAKISSVTDELLHPVLGKEAIDRSDTRVFIDVYIRPNFPTNLNLRFFSDDFEIWNHRWADGIFENIRGWTNAELRARTTQCILRMRVTASNFRAQRLNGNVSFEDRREYLRARSDEQWTIWNGGLRPVAYALMEELQRRIYGEGPHPRNHDLSTIEDGMLAGPDPIGEAALGLESLIRQLP